MRSHSSSPNDATDFPGWHGTTILAVRKDGATVIASVLLPGVRIAATSRVDGSIVGPRATVGQRCVVSGVSVIGADAVIASGTTLDGERYPAGS